MAKVFITNSLDNVPEKSEVYLVHYEPNLLPEEMQNQGIDVEQTLIPQPENRSRKFAKLYINIVTKEMWYEYVDRPPTSEEQIAELQFQNAQVLLALVQGGLI
jgi:hypothetical protein